MKDAFAGITSIVVVAIATVVFDSGREPLSERPRPPFEVIGSLSELTPSDEAPGLTVPTLPPPPGTVSYVDPGTRVHKDDINQVSGRIAEDFVEHLLNIPSFAAKGATAKPIVIEQRAFTNDAGLDRSAAETLAEKIRGALLRTGRVRLATTGEARAEVVALAQEIASSGLYARPKRRAKKRAAPRYILRGRLSPGSSEQQMSEDRSFTLTLTLDNIETAETLWSKETPILEALIK